MQNNREIGLYIHIPFCVRKCLYCDFLSGESTQTNRIMYVNALVDEIAHTYDKYNVDGSKCIVSSIYFGGGTPSILEEELLERVVNKIKEEFPIIKEDAEITIEVNPGTVTKKKLELYRKMGINRLSIGLQSANSDELAMLGRIHSYGEYEECFKLAQKVGFYNISTDIMTALPGQSIEKLKRTLDKVTDLAPEHISAYSLIIEEGTPFYSMYGLGEEYSSSDNGVALLPTEEEERELYYFVREYLIGHGYKQYEISNFAKEGYESRHNSSYWRRKEYIGYGLGSSGLINNTRFKNTTNLNDYLSNSIHKRSIVEHQILNKNDQMEEYMFLGLRTMKGVSVYDFEAEFEMDIHEVFGKIINKLISQGLLEENFGCLYLTKTGIDYGNYVFSEFLL